VTSQPLSEYESALPYGKPIVDVLLLAGLPLIPRHSRMTETTTSYGTDTALGTKQSRTTNVIGLGRLRVGFALEPLVDILWP
jgi:hypothetical protein